MNTSEDNQSRPNRDEFAEAMIKAIVAVRPDLNPQYDPEQFRLLDEKENRQTNLSNIYEEHCQLEPPDRPTHLKMLASIFCDAGGDIAETYDEARLHLRPKIWNRSTFEELELQRQIKGNGQPCDIPLYPLGEHLYSSIVYDLPTAMRSVSMDDLERWGVRIYQAIEDACQNLEELPLSVGRIGDGFYTAVSGDNYDSARLLLTSRLRSLEINGDLIALVPQRDSLFLCGSDDVESLKIMIELTGQVLSSELRPLSPVPLCLHEDGEWHDWQPHADHPLYHQFMEMRNAFLGSLYASQKELLEQLYEKQQEDVFVASYSGIRKKDDSQVLSYCVWGEGVDSLLPETDLVMLPTETDLAAMGYLDIVRKAAGSLMQPVPGLYPKRYRVREFPSYAQLEEIGTISL